MPKPTSAPVIPGTYDVQVIETDLLPAANGKGPDLDLVLKVSKDQGKESGKKIKGRIPIW